MGDPTARRISNWSQLGFVGSVKNQGFSCGDCWAFATLGAYESAYAIKFGKENLVDLSEEQILRAGISDAGGTYSCCGGWWGVFDWMQTNGVVGEENLKTDLSWCCPSQPSSTPCTKGSPAPLPQLQGRRYTVASWAYVDGNSSGVADKAAMKQALCNFGPLVTGILADSPSGAFQNYMGSPQLIQDPVDTAAWESGITPC